MYTTHQMKEAFKTGAPNARMLVAVEMFARLDEHLPWLAAREYVGATISNKGDGWLLILRGKLKGKPQVCFFGGVNPEDCLIAAAYALVFDLAIWKPDKFSTIRSDKAG